MQVAEPPAVVEAAPVQASAEVLVSHDARNELVVTLDTSLPLVKAGRSEDALLRQAVFVTSTLTVVRSTTAPEAETLRWTYDPFLQHQLCFTSMTGLFSCTVAEVTPLPDKVSGEAAIPAGLPDGLKTSPAAEAAYAALAGSLRARGAVLFRDDRRLKIDPLLKAAGVSLRPSAAPAKTRR